MKKTLLSLTVLLSLVFSCGSNNKTDDNVVKVGVPLPLTGDLAQYGQAIKEGIELKIDSINENGGINGKKIDVDYVDSKGDIQEDINIFKKNIQQLDKIYSKLTDELDYGGKYEADLDNLDKSISICREIYFHMQSIELLENKLYLNKENFNAIKELYNTEQICFDVEENKSPVFNYHLSKIIEEIKTLKEFNESIK